MIFLAWLYILIFLAIICGALFILWVLFDFIKLVVSDYRNKTGAFSPHNKYA